MSEPEFRIIIIRILARVKNRLESLSSDIKETKASQNEIKNAITELQSRMTATVARMDEAEERTSNIKDTLMDINGAGKKEGD